MQMILRLTKHSVTRYSFALVGTAAALLFAWPGLFANLFSTGQDLGGFMPHSHCYLFLPSLVRLHLASDLAIGVSYVAISLTLAYLIHRTRRDIPFHWVFLAFGLFIIACGMTHFMEVWTLDTPTYWLAGYVKLVTAAASVATALVLPPLIPRAVRTVSDAKAAEEVARDIGAQYVVTYAPGRPFSDGGERRRIKVTSRRLGLRLVAMRDYVSPRPRPAPN